MTKATATFVFENDDGIKCQIVYDSVTAKMSTSGTAYPWMINSVMEWIAKIKPQAPSAAKSQQPG